MAAYFRCIGIMAMLAACMDDTETETVTNEGRVCVRAGVVRVDMTDSLCLSSSCDTIVSATCTAVVVDDTLQIESSLEVQRGGGRGDCTDDCFPLLARCDLPDDSYDRMQLGGVDVERACD